MAVDQAGGDGPAAQVDGDGTRPDQVCQVVVRAHGHDGGALDGDGPGAGQVRVDGDDVPVDKDAVGVAGHWATSREWLPLTP